MATIEGLGTPPTPVRRPSPARVVTGAEGDRVELSAEALRVNPDGAGEIARARSDAAAAAALDRVRASVPNREISAPREVGGQVVDAMRDVPARAAAASESVRAVRKAIAEEPPVSLDLLA